MIDVRAAEPDGHGDAITDPGHDRHVALLEWIGGGFDPEEFDVTEADESLAAWAEQGS